MIEQEENEIADAKELGKTANSPREEPSRNKNSTPLARSYSSFPTE